MLIISVLIFHQNNGDDNTLYDNNDIVKMTIMTFQWD